MKKFSLLFIAILYLGLQGCASIAGGLSEEITFTSTPDDVAVIMEGKTLGRTPLTASIPKQGGKLEIAFEKEGYKPYSQRLTTKLEPWFWGNIICTGMVGSATDAITGGLYSYAPNQYHISMVPEDGMSLGDRVEPYIIAGYPSIMRELNSQPGEYVNSLFEMLNVAEGEKGKAMEKIRTLSALHTNIPEFAREVNKHFRQSE